MKLDALFESAQELDINTIFDLIFHSAYYPSFFFIHCLYICLYLRHSAASKGFQWWRSFVLGFLLAYFPRFLFSWLVQRILPERQNGSVYLVYLVAWLVMNIFPFDLIFRLLNRVVSRTILAFLAEFGDCQLLIHNIWNSLAIYPDHPITAFYVVITPYFSTLLIEYIDNLIFVPNRVFHLYSFAYLKRVAFLALCLVILTQPKLVLGQSQVFQLYQLIPIAAVLNGLLKLIDILVFRGNPFRYLDIVFPSSVLKRLYHGSA